MDEKLRGLFSEIASTPALKKMGQLAETGRKLGLQEALVDKIVPVLCEFLVCHQAAGKTEEAARFLAMIIEAASEFPSDLEQILSSGGGGR